MISHSLKYVMYQIPNKLFYQSGKLLFTHNYVIPSPWNNPSWPSQAETKHCVKAVLLSLLSDWSMKFQSCYSLPMHNLSKQQKQLQLSEMVHWSQSEFML